MGMLQTLLEKHLTDWQSAWSMGSFGAVAEFMQDEGEELAVTATQGPLEHATARGGIRLDATILEQVLPVAYETLSPKPHRWSHALALCLPQAQAAGAVRSALTELGPDRQAIRPQDREAILFDQGLSLPQCDFCIRTSDPALLAVLRANAGRSMFDPENTAMPAILKAHPHRIAITPLGRIEVYQKIGGPDTGGVSPPGPHTHLLPQLLKSGRTHSANTPIPTGYFPLAFLHPGNPVIGPMGEERDFDPVLFEAFQAIFARYGIADTIALKNAIVEALNEGRDPASFPPPAGRFPRAALRLTLRQQARRAAFLNDAILTQRVAAWRALHDANVATEEEDDAPGH